MAVTTGFQGRTFDVPRTCVPCIDPPRRAPCVAADAVFADAKAFLSSSEARQMSESELERELHRRGPGVGAQAPARTSRPTQPERGCGSGRGHQRCRVLGAARARKPRRNGLRHDAGCGSRLRAARSRRLASARCRAEPAAGALLGRDAPPRDHRDRLAGTTAYAPGSHRGTRHHPRGSGDAACTARRRLIEGPVGIWSAIRWETTGAQPPRVAGALMRTAEEPGQRGAGARPGQAAVTGALSHASCSPPHRSTRPRRPMRRRRLLSRRPKPTFSSREALQMRESDLERELNRRGQELMRKLLQGHLDQRSPGAAGGSGRGGRRCRAFGAAAARPAVGDDLWHGGGRAPGLRASRSRQSASARCVAEPAG